MPNDSSVQNGFIPPTGTQPLAGAALNSFLQAWLVGITGLPGNMVRPAYQAEPPDIPDAGTAWMAFQVGNRKADDFPYIVHTPQETDKMSRQEQFQLLCSFYDLGVNGQADNYAALLSDGALLPQNIEYLESQGFALGFVGDLTPLPTITKQRWLYRIDLPITLRRQIDRSFAVNTITSSQGTLKNDVGYPSVNVGVPHS